MFSLGLQVYLLFLAIHHEMKFRSPGKLDRRECGGDRGEGVWRGQRGGSVEGAEGRECGGGRGEGGWRGQRGGGRGEGEWRGQRGRGRGEGVWRGQRGGRVEGAEGKG